MHIGRRNCESDAETEARGLAYLRGTAQGTDESCCSSVQRHATRLIDTRQTIFPAGDEFSRTESGQLVRRVAHRVRLLRIGLSRAVRGMNNLRVSSTSVFGSVVLKRMSNNDDLLKAVRPGRGARGGERR